MKLFSVLVSVCLAGLGTAQAQSHYEPYSFITLNVVGATLKFPRGVAVNAAGDLYVGNTNDQTIVKITGGVATVIAGQSGAHGFADGTGIAARFDSPSGVAVDSAGNVFVADTFNHAIRRVSPAGEVTTLAGSPGSPGSTDGTGAAARFNGPRYLALDSSGNVLVADSNNHTIRKITPAGVVSTLAGAPGVQGSFDGMGTSARFSFPRGIAVDGTGKIYVADDGNNTIRKITPSGAVSTLAGLPPGGGNADGLGCAVGFRTPTGVTVDNGGNVYVTDSDNQTIRKITPAGLVTTLAGKANVTGTADGTGSDARFVFSTGVAVDSANTLYVLDSSRVRVGTAVPQPAPMVRTVANTNDSGPGSLRQAVMEAVSGDTITFSASLNEQVITLTSGELTLNVDLTISGPGANLLTIQRSSVAGTPAFRIFGVPPGRNITISGLTIRNGDAHGSAFDCGGAIYSDQGNLTVEACALTGNVAEMGGAICNDGGDYPSTRLSLTGSTLSGNSAALGGAIFNGHLPASVFDVTFGAYSIQNCTFSGNSASQKGGAIHNSARSSLRVGNCTFSDNTAPFGSSIETTNTMLTLGNSAFKNGGPGPSITKGNSNPAIQNQGYNVFSDNPAGQSGFFFAHPTDQLNTDPRLGPLQDNGGPTLTHAPLADSPLIDKGRNFASDVCRNLIPTDQRGFPRPVRFNSEIAEPTDGDGSDVGAVELSGPAPNLGNISTRLSVGTGENVLIGGFIIEGSAAKRVMILARGPSLSGQVPNPLPNPRLELHDAVNTIATNNDWQTTLIGGVIAADQRQEIENSGLAPGHSADSAIIATLPPGGYTAVVQDVNGASGVGIVEIFDLEPNVPARLANISTRGFVQSGDNVMIAGVIVVNQPTKVIVRARGRSLSISSEELENPRLELHDETSTIATNDDWQATQIGGVITADQRAEIEDSGLAPGDAYPEESAIIATLQPGVYTAIVQDANGASGIGLVEVFVLP